MAARKRAAVYLRVLRSRRLRQVASFEEHVTAAKARPEFDAMMEAAHRGESDVIVVWALDRFGRSMVTSRPSSTSTAAGRPPWWDDTRNGQRGLC